MTKRDIFETLKIAIAILIGCYIGHLQSDAKQWRDYRAIYEVAAEDLNK